ncbi:DUF481 domain-containing protein [Cerasicoccus fimbriatus]|uniref:DUF481 domain-containing protein n=1 Tax=Cerasicoccus fimbriatus TaxID=3014554 RepID=UPI0022B574C3|nr:DUF481 domain-containing protein [Cerasicoccus sp. TK19100]
MLRLTTLFASLLICASVSADTLVLKNGDRISGTLTSKENGVITFQSDLLGQLTIPESDATVEMPAPPAPSPAEAAAVANATTAAAVTEEATDKESISKQKQEEVDAVTKSIKDTQNWIHENIIPEGWSGKLSFGFRYLESNTETTGVNFDLNGKKDAAPHHYAYDIYYQYSRQTQTNGGVNKNQDQYGAEFDYDYDINDWMFFNASASYLRNQVKDIRHQADLDLGLGFHVIETDDMTLDLIPAYTLQYKDAEGISQKWYNLATLKEEFVYHFSEIVRFEQTAFGSVEPSDTQNYQYGFTAALISKLAEWVEASIAYELTYDNTVGTGGVKREQQIIVGIGVPY